MVTEGPLRGTIVPLGLVGGPASVAPPAARSSWTTTTRRRGTRGSIPQGGQWFVEDLGSTNGTFVADQRVEAPTPAADRYTGPRGTERARAAEVTGDRRTQICGTVRRRARALQQPGLGVRRAAPAHGRGRHGRARRRRRRVLGRGRRVRAAGRGVARFRRRPGPARGGARPTRATRSSHRSDADPELSGHGHDGAGDPARRQQARDGAPGRLARVPDARRRPHAGHHGPHVRAAPGRHRPDHAGGGRGTTRSGRSSCACSATSTRTSRRTCRCARRGRATGGCCARTACRGSSARRPSKRPWRRSTTSTRARTGWSSSRCAPGGGDNITVVLADVVELDDVADGEGPTTNASVVGAAALTRNDPTSADDGPAARAASLTQAGDDEPVGGRASRRDEDDDRAAARRWRVAGRVGRRRRSWSSAASAGRVRAGRNTQYYVGVDDGEVVIFRGLPQTLGPIDAVVAGRALRHGRRRPALGATCANASSRRSRRTRSTTPATQVDMLDEDDTDRPRSTAVAPGRPRRERR